MKKIALILAITILGASYASYAKTQNQEAIPQLEEVITETVEVTVETAVEEIEKKEFYEIVIKDHKFSPEELIVPAGEKIKLIIDNQDPTPEEFESHDLNREKIISGNNKATIFIGPLKPGKYHYFGEFNTDSANGYIIAQ